MKRFRYILEASFLHVVMFFFMLIPLDFSSTIGGCVGRLIGPRLAVSRKALNNLKAALPGLGDGEYRRIIAGMWDNLGRTMAEYPHLRKIGRERVEIPKDTKRLVEELRDDGQPGILYAAHLANWEACAAGLNRQCGLSLDLVYRAPNNPWVENLLQRLRNMDGLLKTIPKSKAGARQIVDSLKTGRHVGILIDQKYNEGLSVPFFGREAMTSPAFVQLAQKYNCPLVPGRMERTGGAHFRLTADGGPLPLFDETGKALPVEQVIADAHARLEKWIQERPEQWLWLHRRWK